MVEKIEWLYFFIRSSGMNGFQGGEIYNPKKGTKTSEAMLEFKKLYTLLNGQ